ncbi:hypothetical protein N0V82_006517 [Gnomoniopsis sp. IMI 355080]|nr:hypothetical protein N0V82_006517 [Gnomoniopsis sp. IMI 355080]
MRAVWAQEERDKTRMRDLISGHQALADIPKRDLLDFVDLPEGRIAVASAIREACLNYPGPANRMRFEEYMSNIPNVGIIIAPAGSGKTKGVATLAKHLVLGIKERVVIAAHSNVAVNRPKDAFVEAALHLVNEAQQEA